MTRSEEASYIKENMTTMQSKNRRTHAKIKQNTLIFLYITVGNSIVSTAEYEESKK